MLINYRFADGETTQVEVSDEVGSFIIESRRAEEAADRFAHRHSFSIDAIQYEGLEYGVSDEYFSENTEEEHERIKEIIRVYRSLSEQQRRRLKLYAQGKTFREIAAIEGRPVSAIHESIGYILKKFKKFM